jgi:hypothetical protein
VHNEEPAIQWKEIRQHDLVFRRAMLGSAWVQYPYPTKKTKSQMWRIMVETILMVCELDDYCVDVDLEMNIRSAFSRCKRCFDLGVLPVVASRHEVVFARVIYTQSTHTGKLWMVQSLHGHVLMNGQAGNLQLAEAVMKTSFDRISRVW